LKVGIQILRAGSDTKDSRREGYLEALDGSTV